MKHIEVISLIYKSTRYLDFIVEQLSQFATSYDDFQVTYRIVANDATDRVKNHLSQKSIPYSIFDNADPNEYYINRVYKAYNYAGQTSKADYVCFVNSDMGFSPNWLKNLSKNIADDRILTSRLVESGKMPSGAYGITANFGNTPESYQQDGFIRYAQSISDNCLARGGLFMPLLISQKLFCETGGFPAGNIYCDGVGTCTGGPIKSGDAYYFYDVLESKYGICHYTSFDSIVYHFQEGEKDE